MCVRVSRHLDGQNLHFDGVALVWCCTKRCIRNDSFATCPLSSTLKNEFSFFSFLFLSGRWIHSFGACNHANGLYLIVSLFLSLPLSLSLSLSLPVSRAWLYKLVYACHHDLLRPSWGSRGREFFRTIVLRIFRRGLLYDWITQGEGI